MNRPCSFFNLHSFVRTAKEEAMHVVIRLAKHHPVCVCDNILKIVVAVCNEVKNFRQSVAGKAVLTLGYLYEIMGKKLENKLRLVIGALLAKSGNRTLSAYFRLTIKSLFKIMNSTTAHKTALAFIHEGARHCGKRMFQVFKNNRKFNKLKEQHLEINTIENLAKILEQIETKGVSEEYLPINIIK
ncbi:TOG array regulator of axonemal microtubules protein 1 [Nephila pilipes]|uniref:TOG array regulator of axonemal microtubules protein 1 n=1 Tax=Nephila pilipes TaxID=299642 RepID=A0A8X6U7T1_NEPPI|nr:TOG array regulator of axonemal microtubules protein 1 [Nephila pilipes]GFT59579.1 TOG array regulator of axonemal microtubules protein 1 [Nephila pilipes]GFT86959.1 TOG array regulator of axonemal microtubules protein 1 [Nephila pilipes]